MREETPLGATYVRVMVFQVVVVLGLWVLGWAFN